MAYMRKTDQRLLFLPLGGSGEIGMNLNLYAHQGKWLMVDCGMMFADDYTPGVELILPDPGFIEDEKDNLLALLVTHGHEDHIGAIPYLWERFRCPVYATPFTAELIKGKLKEAGLLEEVEIILVEPSQGFDLGPFRIKYVPLAHSIAEGHGIAIKTDAGTLFHTGDWKLDDKPLIGPVCPSPELSALGDEGVLALIGDSTNVFNAGSSGSEAEVRENLIKEVQAMDNRVVITTFASNVARMETIGEVAKATGRHLALMGRSMQRVLSAGKATGYLQNLPTLVDEEHIADIPRDRLLIACTGCQGEPRAAIARIARDEHKMVHLSPGDNVIFSSKIIPGNELTLGALFNSLAQKKINVMTEKDAFIHVSGHPGRAELEKMYGWVKPKSVIPVHGEARHLMRHAAFAREMQIHNTIVPENGDLIEIAESGLTKIDQVPTGRIVLDGKEIVALDDAGIAERRRASQSGFVTVSVIFDDDHALAAEPALAILGLPRGQDPVFQDTLVDNVENALDRMKPKGRGSDMDVEEVCRIAVRRCCRKMIGKNPGVATLITRREHIDFR
jgi:ribonuclease J